MSNKNKDFKKAKNDKSKGSKSSKSKSSDKKDNSKKKRSTTRRALLKGGAAAGLGGAGYTYYTNRNDFGEFEIGLRDRIPFITDFLIDFPFFEYYSSSLSEVVKTIDERAESEINGRNVSRSDNKILKDLDYYTDEEVFRIMENKPGFVGDAEEVTRLLNWNHYSTIRMGIKAGGDMKDINQYLAKDLQVNYANNASEPFHKALNIVNEVAHPYYDIDPASDERDDQIVGIELYMLGNGNSRAGRYFNTTEIERYAEGSLKKLRNRLEEEAIEPDGFTFYL